MGQWFLHRLKIQASIVHRPLFFVQLSWQDRHPSLPNRLGCLKGGEGFNIEDRLEAGTL